MRTTITLEDDVATALKRLGKGRGLKFKALVNLALREGIKSMTAPAKKRRAFQTTSVDLGSSRSSNVDNVAEVLAVAEGESFK
jgi:UDP:flavonoid glycosyltransferase YjiC (YdhE family)